MADFKEFLYNHIPHRWLNPKSYGTNKLFTGLGNILDTFELYTDSLQRNNSTRTALELLPDLENEYAIEVKPSYDVDYRRKLIIAKKRMQDSPITLPNLINLLLLFNNIVVKVENNFNASTMRIFFEPKSQLPTITPEVRQMIEENIRAHVFYTLLLYDLIKIFVNINIETKLIIKSDFDILSLGKHLYLDGSWFLDDMYYINGYKILLLPERCPANLNLTSFVNMKLDTLFRLKYSNSFLPKTLTKTKTIIKSEFDILSLGKHLYLDGSWFLDNTYWINGYKSILFLEHYTVNLNLKNFINCNIKSKSTLKATKDVWVLDGQYNLDGTRLLGIEKTEFEL